MVYYLDFLDVIIQNHIFKNLFRIYIIELIFLFLSNIMNNLLDNINLNLENILNNDIPNKIISNINLKNKIKSYILK